MLEYDRAALFKGTDVNKMDGSCECIIWYLLEKKLKFQPEVCNGCYN